MRETNNNNQNTEWQPESQNAENVSGQHEESSQNYYNNPYYNGQQSYPNPYYNGPQYYGPYYEQNTGYNNQQYYGPYYGQQPYANPQYAYNQPQPMREPVTNVFYYVLMALTAACAAINIIASAGLISAMLPLIDFESIGKQDYVSLYSSMMYYFSNSPAYSAYSVLSSLLGFAILAVSIIDIVQVYKKRYPILGLVLFSILCKPGYFIWRAHVLKQKKLIPVLFTISYLMLYIGYFFWCLFYIVSFI